MLASPGTPEEAGPGGFVLERKYDGFRALGALAGGRTALQSRNALDLAGRFPEVAHALARLPAREAVLDGEIVAVGPRGPEDFEALQQGKGAPGYVAFDLLWLDGRDLRALPLEERRARLEALLRGASAPLLLSERVSGEVEPALERAARAGQEGLIAKRVGSRYEGRRSRAWLKLKVVAAQELVIVGYLPISNGAAAIGALLLGVNGEGGLRYAGKVGTGFTTEVRGALFRDLRRLEDAKPPVLDPPRERGVRWVRPERVAQVGFTSWTRDGRLRHPRFLGLREDKPASEVVREPAATGRKRAPRAQAAKRR
jgi:bifunctional non-homologous end joining protein LigD